MSTTTIKKNKVDKDGWCFAIVNGRLAEIYFCKKYGIHGHCYVKKEEFSKREQKMIEDDTKKCGFAYRDGFYIDKINGIKQKKPPIEKVFPEIRKYRIRPSSIPNI